MSEVASGYMVGNGAAINISLGWFPDFVVVTNLTDGDKITMGHLGGYSIPFSSGGTTTIAAGNLITGATSGATAYVKSVLLSSGTWAAGDAAGFFIVDEFTGTFASENVFVPGGSNDATITAAVQISTSIDTEVAAETGNAAISRYAGSIGSAAIGFTIGSTVAEEAKLLFWLALRGDQYAIGQ